jgi:ribosome recycling factor
MPTDDIELQCEEQMEKAVAFLNDELRSIRTGRASPGLVEHMKIDVSSYGSTMDLRELASISVPENNMIIIKPYDPGTLKDIERSIQSSDLGIAPASDGKVIRLPIPPLSGERRKQLVNQIRKLGENQKIALRNIRRDANKKADTEQKDKIITEDEAEKCKENIQEQTKQYEQKVDQLVENKAKEIEEQ